jgi:hypothetical protein
LRSWGRKAIIKNQFMEVHHHSHKPKNWKELDNKIDELQNEIASKYHINVEKSSK